MALKAAEDFDVMLLAGLTWHRTGKNSWTASDRFAAYTIFREPDDRWYGQWERDGEKTAADWSCPTLETFAEYMVDNARRQNIDGMD